MALAGLHARIHLTLTFFLKRSNSQFSFGKATTDSERSRVVAVSAPSRSGAFGLGHNLQSAWLRERALRLHIICGLIQERVSAGQSLNKACQVFSKRWTSKHFHCDPTRRYALSRASMYRHYRAWLRGGETPSAFQLKYFSTNRRIPARVLVRFIELCAKLEFASFRSAWETFCRRGGNAGPGRVKGRRLKLSYHALYRNCPKSCFTTFKKLWQIIQRAHQQIQMARLKYTAEIRAHVPDRLPSRRAKREIDFQI
jgi:hypothetical protein